MNKKNTSKQEYLRELPSVETVISAPDVRPLMDRFTRGIVVAAVQRVLASRRNDLLSLQEPGSFDLDRAGIISPEEICREIEMLCRPSLQRVINATGIIIHTNLGRAPLSKEALRAVTETAGHYCNLEFSLEQGSRGSRQEHIEDLITEITGAAAGFAVNNNAAAVLLVLSTLAAGRRVLVSRGELMEIGGSFRIPDIMEHSGALLCEVGTTNRTRIHDYESAVTEDTALIFKAHPSNYRIQGFSGEAELSELVALGKKHGLPVVMDLGSGTFIDANTLGIAGEPTVGHIVQSGVDIVTFSGDKLLGGPQAGIIAGKKDLIDVCRKNPLARAVRIDKIRLAALEATMRGYRFGSERTHDIPVVGMLRQSDTMLKRKAHRFYRAVKKQIPALECTVERETSYVGGGACPAYELPTWVAAARHPEASPNRFENSLRRAHPPVIARIGRDRVLFDMRTVGTDEIPLLVNSIASVCKSFSADPSVGR